MADLITRPDSRPASTERRVARRAPARHAGAAAPQSSPRIRIEVDGRVVEGFEGQTILEVCRDNGIEIPTLCYEPKLPGLRGLPDVRRRGRGRGASADLVLARVRAGDEGPDPDRGAAPAAPDQPRADLQRPQRVLPAALPEQVPEPHRHPGLPQGQRRGRLAREHADLQAHDPVPERPRPGLPGAVRGALPARRGRRGDRHPRQPPLRRRPGPQGDARRGRGPAAAVRAPGADRPAAAVIGSGPAGMAAAFYLLLAGHDVTVFERDPAPGGMLRYGIPQYRLPKVEVLEAEYESVTRLGGKIVCNAGLGRDFTLDDLTLPGLRFGRRRDRLLRHEQARHPRRGRRRGPRRARVPADRDARPAVPGPRRQARRRHRRRVHLDGLLADVGPPGRGRGHARLPPRHEGHAGGNEVHEAIEEGVTAIFQAGPVRVITDKKGNVTGVEFIRMALGAPDASGRRRPEPAPGHRVHDPVRPRPAGDRPGSGARLAGAARQRGPEKTKQSRLKADAVTFETGRPGVFGTGDVRIGAATVVQAIAEGRRAAYAVDAYLKGMDLAAIRTRQTLAEPQPEFLSIVPFTSEAKDAALPDDGARGGGAQPQLHRVRAAVHARGRGRRIDPLPPVHLRGDRLLRPAPPRASSTGRRSRRSSRSTTRARATGA